MTLTLESLAALFCALGVAFIGYTLAVILANWWADQWYSADGSAHHCESCGSPWLQVTSAGPDDWYDCTECGDLCGVYRSALQGYCPSYRDDCIRDVMTWARYAGPLLAVGVGVALLWSI